MDDDYEVKIRSELAGIINTLECAEARFELATFESRSESDQARDRALVEVRNALAAARLAAAAFGDVPSPIRH